MRKIVATIAVASLAAALLLGVASIIPWGWLFNQSPPGDVLVMGPPEPSETSEPEVALDACHVNAITAYMTAQGFTDGQYVIGEENVDTTAAEYSAAGATAFGNVVGSREELQKMFGSQDPALKAATEVQVRKLPDYDRKLLLDANNWEILQVTVATAVSGNTGFSGGKVVDAGTRASAAGDAFWLFVDPESCVIPKSKINSLGETTDTDTVPIIRVGCINPGDGIEPKNPNLDPDRRGNNRPGGGGHNPGVGNTPPSPPAGGDPPEVYVPPTPPSPPPTLVPDDTPAPSPEPEAPTPQNPETECIPAPGRTCA